MFEPLQTINTIQEWKFANSRNLHKQLNARAVQYSGLASKHTAHKTGTTYTQSISISKQRGALIVWPNPDGWLVISASARYLLAIVCTCCPP
jgi:hypothetical protein